MSAAITAAMLGDLAARATLVGVDEMTILRATERQMGELGALPDSRCSRQPMYSVEERCWRILETVRVKHLGISFVAHRSHLATADELDATRTLWSVR